MPFQMKTFMEHVATANTHFKKWKSTSSLDSLIAELGGAYVAARGVDVRDLSNARGAKVRRAVYKLSAAKRLKYTHAITYLLASEPDLAYRDGTIIGFHENRNYAVVVVTAIPGGDSFKHEVIWYRGLAEQAYGHFSWTPNAYATSWIQAGRTVPPVAGETPAERDARVAAAAARTRQGMGTFMVYYQAHLLCKTSAMIYSGVPEGEHARAFRTRLGFVPNPRPALPGFPQPLDDNGQPMLIGMKADVATVKARTLLRCPGWHLVE